MPAKGIERVKSNLKKELNKCAKERTGDAVYAILFQGSEASKLLTPIDVGTLVASLYAPRISFEDGRVVGTVGYTAAYAKAVHEAPGKLKGLPRANFGKTAAGVKFGGGTGNGRYWDPDAEPKFLEKGFEMIRSAIPRILKEYQGAD